MAVNIICIPSLKMIHSTLIFLQKYRGIAFLCNLYTLNYNFAIFGNLQSFSDLCERKSRDKPFHFRHREVWPP